jgi:hypothetical protein
MRALAEVGDERIARMTLTTKNATEVDEGAS